MTHSSRTPSLSRILVAAAAVSCGLQASFSYGQVLEETLVTATKRVSSLQDVPVSVVAMSGERISENSITGLTEFSFSMPSVSVGQNPIGNSISIRGVGSGANSGIEQSAAIFHDGVYMGRSPLAQVPFIDLERVEVLRGPQSVLFGKNTIAGVFSIITAKPTDEFEGSISGLYGWEEEEKEIVAVLSGPLTNTLSGRVAYRGYETDGYIENVLTGKDGPAQDNWTFRGQLHWKATNNLDINLKVESSAFEADQQATQLAVFNPLTPLAEQFSSLNEALLGGLEKYDDKRAVVNDGGAGLAAFDPRYEGVPGFPNSKDGMSNDVDLLTLNVDWMLGEYTLSSVTGYVSYDSQVICDCDFSALPMVAEDGNEDYDQFSQELRIASPLGNTFEYMAGVYYHKADLDYQAYGAFGLNILGVANVSRDYGMDQDQEQWAVFGSLTWNFSDQTRATFGLRYSDEEKEAKHRLVKRFTEGWDYGAPFTYGRTPEEYDRFEQEMSSTGLPGFMNAAIWAGALGTWEHDIAADRQEDFITWSANVQHDFNDDSMGYVSVSTGFKGGGFDARFLKESLDDGFEFDDEEAINYEIGVKSELQDGRIRLNATLFLMEIDDLQKSVFDGSTGFLVTNAAETESKGVEFEGQWAATEGLTLGLAATYLDNTFKDFPNAPCWASQNVADPVGCADGNDISGEPNTFSPEWVANFSADYAIAIGNSLEARAWVNMNYSDGYFTGADLDPDIAYQDSYTRVDARLSLGADDSVWEVALIGKNLTDEKISNTSDDRPLVPADGFKSLDRLRSYAVQATYRF